MITEPVEAVFFDLGRVIVDFDYLPAIGKLFSSCRPGKIPDENALSDRLFHPLHGINRAFDTGKLTPEEFHDQLCQRFSYTGSFDEFVALWNGIFISKPEVEEIIRALAGRTRLFIISNTNPLHFAHIVRHYDILNTFEDAFLSYRIGACKPEREIFQAALDRTGVDASRAIFIDDMKNHVEAAKKLGFQGSHFISAKTLKEVLSPLLIPE